MMKNVRPIYVKTGLFMLIILWVYAAIIKLSNFHSFQEQMQKQILFPFLKSLLVYLLPVAELGVAILIAIEKTRKTGLVLSILLLTLFSGYIALALFHFLGKIPCSCGGLLERMTWTTHLYFNISFIVLNLSILHITIRKEHIGIE